MEKKLFLKKITLPSQKLRYLVSGKSVFRLIAKDYNENVLPLLHQITPDLLI